MSMDNYELMFFIYFFGFCWRIQCWHTSSMQIWRIQSWQASSMQIHLVLQSSFYQIWLTWICSELSRIETKWRYLLVQLGACGSSFLVDCCESAADKLSALQPLLTANWIDSGSSPTSPMLDSTAGCVRQVPASPAGVKSLVSRSGQGNLWEDLAIQ